MADLKQNTRIEFNIDSLKGTGKIVGVATIGLPIIGCSYIIEPDEPIKNEAYEYTHFVAFESQFKTI